MFTSTLERMLEEIAGMADSFELRHNGGDEKPWRAAVRFSSHGFEASGDGPLEVIRDIASFIEGSRQPRKEGDQ